MPKHSTDGSSNHIVEMTPFEIAALVSDNRMRAIRYWRTRRHMASSEHVDFLICDLMHIVAMQREDARVQLQDVDYRFEALLQCIERVGDDELGAMKAVYDCIDRTYPWPWFSSTPESRRTVREPQYQLPNASPPLVPA